MMLHRRMLVNSVQLAGIATVTAALSLGISHEAMAACAPSAASPNPVIACEGTGNTNDTDVTQSGVVAASGIILAPADAVPDDDSVADVTNTADLSLAFTGAATANPNIRGINADDFGTYTIVNAGNIRVSSTGRGQAYGIAGNGDVTNLIAINSGLIEATRNLGGANGNPLQITSATINVTNLANAGSGNNATTTSLGIAAGVFTEEELDSEELTNTSTGTIRAIGKHTIGVYSRAEEFTLTNEGLIEHAGGAGNGIAIGVVSDSGKISTFEFTNTGTVTGDVVMTGAHAQRWWLLSKGEGKGNISTGNVIGDIQIDNRLNINAQFGQLDTEIENEGTITGNLYYGNGTHELVNAEGATITGNIDIDQRNQVVKGRTCVVGAAGCFATATTAGQSFQGNPAPAADEQEPSPNSASIITTGAAVGATTTYTLNMWGSKEFNFENAGTYKGDITIATAPATTIGGIAVGDSKITLSPHVYGGGGASANAATGPGTIATFQGTLKVADGMVNGAGGTSSIARTTTIAPVLSGAVKDGQWFKVSNGLFGEDLPEVSGATALLSWEAAKNSSGALVIGADVLSGKELGGLSKPGAATLDGLLSSDSDDPEFQALALAVLSSQSEEEVREAAEQLAPDTTFGTQQAAFTLSQILGNVIDGRIASGWGGGAGGGFAPPSGLGMGSGQMAQPSYLGATGGGDSVAAGRTGFWGQGFGSALDQDGSERLFGYDAQIAGVAVGIDEQFGPGFRLGAAFSYANTNIDEGGLRSDNRTDVDSYTGLVYAALGGNGWYLSGQTGYTLHNYDTQRTITVPFETSAGGSHDGDQFHIGGEYGVPMRFGSTLVVPLASLDYNRLQQDAYEESGVAGLAVGEQTNDSLVSGLGVKIQAPLAQSVSAQGRAIWYHEFLDVEQNVTARFAAGDVNFLAAGPAVGRDTANLGASLVFGGSGGLTASLDYDAFLREDFVGHSGMGRFRLEF